MFSPAPEGPAPEEIAEYYLEFTFILFGFVATCVNTFLEIMNCFWFKYLIGVFNSLLIFGFVNVLRKIFVFFVTHKCEEMQYPYATQCQNQRWNLSWSFMLEAVGLLLTMWLVFSLLRYLFLSSKVRPYLNAEEDEERVAVPVFVPLGEEKVEGN